MKRIILTATAVIGLLGTTPLYAQDNPTPTITQCKSTNAQEISDLFTRWNNSLATGDSTKVASNYAEQSLLLPTLSNTPRYTPSEKIDYFNHFLQNQPQGQINSRFIYIGCNNAIDSGLYTFNFAKTGKSVQARYTFTYGWDGKNWLITSHHSSLMPETAPTPVAKH